MRRDEPIMIGDEDIEPESKAVDRTVMVPSKQVTPGSGRVEPPGKPTLPATPVFVPRGTPAGVAPKASTRPWKSFSFKKLEKVSRSQALLTEQLEWLVPSVTAMGRVNEAVLERLTALFEVPSDLVVESVHVLKPRELRRYVSEPTFLATLAPLPHKTRGFIEIELALAHVAIDLLIGGAGDTVALRPLTDIEEGVMGFVVLEALRALSPNVEPGLPRLRMEGLVHGIDEATALLGDEAQVAMVQFKCVLGPHTGFIRLFIPSTVVSLVAPPERAPERRARQRARAQRNIARLAGEKIWLRAEIGHAEISSRDLATLGKGDVVLTDTLTVRSDHGESGSARLRVGTGLSSHVAAEVAVENGRYVATVTEFRFGEPRLHIDTGEPEAHAQDALADGRAAGQDGPGPGDPPADDDEDSTHPTGSRGRRIVDETLNEGAELLNDIPLQIAVELARVPVSAEQVVSLHVGQIIDLNRVPGEPVELSVNGKVVARGELVEVEGHLGVRILTMAG